MKKLIIFANMCFFLVVCLASFSQSAPIPDLKGVWTGTATVAWARGGGPGSTPPLGQKFMDYTISITITDQNQDLVLGKMEVRSTLGPIDNLSSPGPSVSTDFAGVVYGGNELHFCLGNITGPIGFGKLSLRSPLGTKNKTISGHWVGSLEGLAMPFQGTAARFSVSKRTVIPPPTPGGK